MSTSPIYTRFIDKLADSIHMGFADGNDDPDSLLFYRPGVSSIGGGSTEAFFTVKADIEELKYLIDEPGIQSPLTSEELAELEGMTFKVTVKLLE